MDTFEESAASAVAAGPRPPGCGRAATAQLTRTIPNNQHTHRTTRGSIAPNVISAQDHVVSSSERASGAIDHTHTYHIAPHAPHCTAAATPRRAKEDEGRRSRGGVAHCHCHQTAPFLADATRPATLALSRATCRPTTASRRRTRPVLPDRRPPRMEDAALLVHGTSGRALFRT